MWLPEGARYLEIVLIMARRYDGFYESMPECPVLCTGMNGILIIPSPLVGEG